MSVVGFKIFFSFWLVFAILIALFALLRDRGSSVRLMDHVRHDGLVAAALLEREGQAACGQFSGDVEEQTHMSFALFENEHKPVCHSPSADPKLIEEADVAAITVVSPSGKTFTDAGAALPGFDAQLVTPRLRYDNLALAIIVSGLVCFTLAGYLARPLQQVRDASRRLAAGDLQARVGPSVGSRRDEIGDLVRDFDAMAARLELLVQSQTQLLSDISHELRSPLARLNVALELARRKAGREVAVDLDRIEEEAERMNDLIGRVLALARAESVEPEEAAVPVELAEIVQRVADNADYEAKREEKSVSVHLASKPVVTVDSRLIASAIDNVVRNAVRYTARHSTVKVVVDSKDHDAVVTVRDHGPGVAPAELERIFSPFHRVETARDRQTAGEGFGLGLAIAKRAVAVYRGAITAENVPDGGLRVTIRIPVDNSLRSVDVA